MRSWLVVVLAVGCSRSAPPPAAPAPAPPVAGAAVAERGSFDPALCAEYQAQMRGAFGDKPEPEEAFSSGYGLPVSAAWRKIPYGDPSQPSAAYELPASPNRWVNRSGPPPAHDYVQAEANVPLREVKALRASLPRQTALRLLVAKPGADLAAQHKQRYPRTPDVLVDWISATGPASKGLDVALAMLIELGKPCLPALMPFRDLADDGDVEKLVAGIADGLARCSCEMEDVDSFVSLALFSILAGPSLGYLPLDEAVLARLPDDATVAELAAELEKLPR